jgi:sugar phosphate isomerase/epimerase
MKKNIFLEYGFHSDYQNRARLIKEMGFDGVFLEWKDNLEEIAHIVRSEGLTIETIHLPFALANSLWEDTDDGNTYYEQIKMGIMTASQLQIKTVIVHTIRGLTPPPISSLGLKRMQELIELARRKKVYIALENIRMHQYIDYFYQNIDSPWLKFCFDAGHANCFSQDIQHFAWHQYADKLVCVHLHDNEGLKDQHRLPFLGNINWEIVMHELKINHYQGPLTLEVVLKTTEGLDEREFLATAKQAIDQLEQLYDK